jgi:hypothetical protein
VIARSLKDHRKSGYFIIIGHTEKLDSGKIAPLLIAGGHHKAYIDLSTAVSTVVPLALVAQNGVVMPMRLHQGA